MATGINQERQTCRHGRARYPFLPRIIDDGLFYKVQAGRKHRYKKPWPQRDIINLFTGLMFNVNDGHPMHISAVPSRIGKLLPTGLYLMATPGD